MSWTTKQSLVSLMVKKDQLGAYSDWTTLICAILEPTFIEPSVQNVTTDQICQSLTYTANGACKRSRPLDVCLNRYDNSASYLLRNNSFLPALDGGVPCSKKVGLARAALHALCSMESFRTRLFTSVFLSLIFFCYLFICYFLATPVALHSTPLSRSGGRL